jgi:hypothetical protein
MAGAPGPSPQAEDSAHCERTANSTSGDVTSADGQVTRSPQARDAHKRWGGVLRVGAPFSSASAPVRECPQWTGSLASAPRPARPKIPSTLRNRVVTVQLG